ncbi:MAG TPA: VTT domain-containing protein [Bacteroidales bacterium]|jgi:membrane protein DedA with SNARE-associated domain|nr:VTT domain-containing protein [Bacteroidales bacterium]
MLSWYAYLLAFTGISLEGEIALITASIASQKGHFTLWIVILIALMATILVDWGIFFGSRLLGAGLYKLFPSLELKVAESHNRFDQRRRPILFLYRFMYGFRVITLIMLGMSKVSASRFIISSLVAITAWVTIYSLLGYYLGHLVHKYFDVLDHYIWYLFIAVILLIVIIFTIKTLSKKVLD